MKRLALLLLLLLPACVVHHEVRWKNGLTCRCSHKLVSVECVCVPFLVKEQKDLQIQPRPSDLIPFQTAVMQCPKTK